MARNATAPLPHSWDIESWPSGVWPGADKARLLVRSHRAELHAHGALTRIGRTLVFRGAGYEKWLNANVSRVIDYELPCNRPEHAAKRFQARQ